MKYRYAGAERRYSIGSVPLAHARVERDRVKALLKEGIDPVAERQRRRTANVTAEIERASFADLADEWFERNKRYWSDVHYDTARQAFKRDVLPHLGNLPVKSVVPVMITPIVEAILRRGSDETARRVLQHIRKVFQYGVGKGIIATNPASATHEMLPPTRTIKHRPAITDLDELRDLLGDADRAACTEATRMAHRLTAFSASRIGPVVEASWPEFDLDAPLVTWTIPRAKREGLEKFYSETLGLAGRHSPHSWRSAFSSILRDRGHERDVVELALDHVKDPNAVLRAYDRGQRTAKRIDAAVEWDRLLAGEPADSSVLLLHRKPGGWRKTWCDCRPRVLPAREQTADCDSLANRRVDHRPGLPHTRLDRCRRRTRTLTERATPVVIARGFGDPEAEAISRPVLSAPMMSTCMQSSAGPRSWCGYLPSPTCFMKVTRS